jgi:hypothetical protein
MNLVEISVGKLAQEAIPGTTRFSVDKLSTGKVTPQVY